MVTLQPRPKKRHPVDWVTASPLWQPYLSQNQDQPEALELHIEFRQPALLRFTSDSFMEDFLTVATTTPERLHLWRVQKETWRIPAPTPLVDLPPDDDGQADRIFAEKSSGNDLTNEQKAELEELGLVKLYQPANQRFYLVTANLVCRIPGLPDRMLNLSNGEQVSFVLRRVIDGKEYALIDEAWHLIADFDDERLNEQSFATLYPGEQQFSMSPVTYYAASDGHQRRMFTGLLPVSGREKFINTEINHHSLAKSNNLNGLGSDANDSQNQTDTLVDQLMTVVDVDVLQPWDALIQPLMESGGVSSIIDRFINESLEHIKESDDQEGEFKELKSAVIKQRDQFRVSSTYIALDFNKFIRTYLNSLWEAIEDPSKVDSLKPQTRKLFNKLGEAKFESGNTEFENSETPEDYKALVEGVSSDPPNQIQKTLLDFLGELEDYRTSLEQAKLAYDSNNPKSTTGWPPEFLLCGQSVRTILKDLKDKRDKDTKKISKPGLIRLALEESLGDGPTKRLPLIPLSQKISQSDIEQTIKSSKQQSTNSSANQSDEDSNQFLIRCVFERPHCPPSLRQVVSQPSLKFQMASYFDPDAPARPIRIPLPVDTTPAGLRKFTKNTMFAISDSLACQVELARKLTFGDLVRSVLPWPLHKGLPDPRSGNCKEKGIDIGKLCTLSIPIITICAFILLIIIVLLLDQIFKWVPYLIYCLPLPGLKAKKGGNP